MFFVTFSDVCACIFLCLTYVILEIALNNYFMKFIWPSKRKWLNACCAKSYDGYRFTFICIVSWKKKLKKQKQVFIIHGWVFFFFFWWNVRDKHFFVFLGNLNCFFSIISSHISFVDSIKNEILTYCWPLNRFISEIEVKRNRLFNVSLKAIKFDYGVEVWRIASVWIC